MDSNGEQKTDSIFGREKVFFKYYLKTTFSYAILSNTEILMVIILRKELL